MDKSQTNVTGLILCGGKGTRIGNRDKGLVSYKDKPLVQHMIDKLNPQVDHLIVNINQNAEKYAEFDVALTSDTDDNFQGPLAGIQSAGTKITTEFCFVVPCDMPHLPLDTVARLLKALDNNPAIAVSNKGRVQPLVLLLRTSVIATIKARLAGDNRSVLGWLESIGYATENFDDSVSAFQNLNTPEQFK